MALDIETRRFTLDEYERMVAAGIFRDDERVEFIDGGFVCMPPIGMPHIICVDRRLAVEIGAGGGGGAARSDRAAGP